MADDWTNNWWAVAPAYWTVNIYDTPREYLSGLRKHSEPVQHLLAVHWCMSEVMNGGLQQFFTNSTGIVAPEALAGFQAMKMLKISKPLEGAMTLLGDTYPRNSKLREKAVDRLFNLPENSNKDPFTRFENPFFKLCDECAEAADKYAADHALIPQTRKARTELKSTLAKLEADCMASMKN
jgi:Domain of unknown function (DUF4375)